VLGLAQKLEIELRKRKQVTVHAYADGEHAVGTILKALATVPTLLGHGDSLSCTAGGVQLPGESSPRVIVHASAPPSWSEPSSDFIAYPPGANPSESTLARFRDAVRWRLLQGETVAMQCRGSNALWHGVEALARVQGNTAEVEVRWVDAFAQNQ
ncbi:unnamed protein product, partial [Polarella glacialis]